MSAWSGAGYVHPYISIFGCGHTNCNDNGLYAFDIEQDVWLTLSSKTIDPVDFDINNKSIDMHPDGKPTSRHTYGVVIG